MPEVTFTPINQCSLDDPSDGADLPSPIGAVPQNTCAEALVCVDPTPESEGSEGADELVQRFQAAAPPPSTTPSFSRTVDSCTDDVLRALSSCGSAVLAASRGASAAAVLAAVSCGSAVQGAYQCIEPEH